MTESNWLQKGKDQNSEQLEEELRTLKCRLEANLSEHSKVQKQYEVKKKELQDKKERLQQAQQ